MKTMTKSKQLNTQFYNTLYVDNLNRRYNNIDMYFHQIRNQYFDSPSLHFWKWVEIELKNEIRNVSWYDKI